MVGTWGVRDCCHYYCYRHYHRSTQPHHRHFSEGCDCKCGWYNQNATKIIGYEYQYWSCLTSLFAFSSYSSTNHTVCNLPIRAQAPHHFLSGNVVAHMVFIFVPAERFQELRFLRPLKPVTTILNPQPETPNPFALNPR